MILLSTYKNIKRWGTKEKKNRAAAEQAKTRASAMEQIDINEAATIDYGGTANPLKASDMRAQVKVVEDGIAKYNKWLDQADGTANDIIASETKLKKMFSGVLKSAVAKFTDNSNYIEMLGGIRSSERKRPVRKPKP